MNAEIKQRWVDALKSGKYEQGRLDLRKGDKWCCLGVLCDVVQAEIALPVTQNSEGTVYLFGERHRASVLPEEVQRLTGLSATGKLSDGRVLANLNDDGVSFSKIAGIIEDQL